MRIADPVTYKVYVAGRGEVRLVDVMKEMGVDFPGFPRRIYHRDNYDVVIGTSSFGEPYYEVTFDLGANHLSQGGFTPSVVSKEPIPYIIACRDLYEYESGYLHARSGRRKERQPAFGARGGEVLFEVLGKAGKGLRVRLPHRPEREWVLVDDYTWRWLDRRPSKLELRLRELQLDSPFAQDHRHPLFTADWLLDFAFKERWTLTYDGGRINWMAIERWEDERQHEDLGIDEAIVALKNGILTEDRSDWGALSDDLVKQYIKADWGRTAPDEQIQQMTDLWLIERRMIRAAMQTVAQARQMYARDAFDRLLS